ncbi:hypothetical protein KC19_VG091500, partial [Ceratodon purpureus]
MRCILRETGDGGGGSSERETHRDRERECLCSTSSVFLSLRPLSTFYFFLLLFPLLPSVYFLLSGLRSLCPSLALCLRPISLYFLLFSASLPLATKLLLFTLRFVFSLKGSNNVFAHIVFNGFVYPKKKSP